MAADLGVRVREIVRGGDIQRVRASVRRYAELLQIISARTLKTRYRGSVLGVYWSLSNPIIMTGVYAVIFGAAFRPYYGNSLVKYGLATFAGLAMLNFFSASSSQALTSVVVNGSLLNRVRLPMSVFPVSVVTANLFQFMVGTFPALCLITLFSTHRILNIAALVVPSIALILVSVGFSLVTSALYVFFRDLPYMYELVIFIIWISSPIFYPASLVQPGVRPLLAFNPIIYIVESVRQIATTPSPPDVQLMLASLASGIVCFSVGTIVFLSLRKSFMDLL